MAMLDGDNAAAPAGRTRQRPISCQECTIQIGDGYQESIPFDFVLDDDNPSSRILKVCWRCWESLNRRKLKRLSEGEPPASPGFR